MSNLAKLLESRGTTEGAANLAKAANPTPEGSTPDLEISQISRISRGVPTKTNLPADLQARLCQMGRRWEYTPEELAEVIELARLDPVKWHLAVALDESREAEFRASGVIR